MPIWESFGQFLKEAEQTSDIAERQALVDQLLVDHQDWPWIEGTTATFIFSHVEAVKSVALNLDIIEGDPPFAPMKRLEGTSFWYVQRQFARDDLLDYLLAVNDPMTPLRVEKDILGRIQRYWRVDPRNPHRISTAQMETSVLRMPQARPFPNWVAMLNVARGVINEHSFDSHRMGYSDRKVWVYTPPHYDPADGKIYPLLILMDGQWMVGPLQVPYIANALIKHGRMQPAIIAMIQSGSEATRLKDYVSNDHQYASILTELLPLLQTEYLVDSTNLAVGGVGLGAVAAAHAALKNPAVFNGLIMLSPPLGRGQAQKQLVEYADRFKNAPLLPRRIFQSVGRYEIKTRFYKPGIALAGLLHQRQAARGDISHSFVELGSGHGLVAFRSVLPEALSHIYPVT